MSDDLEITASDGLGERRDYQMRYALAQALGENIGGNSDYYEEFNWDKNPGVEDYYALALRNPYAYAVTFLGAETTWRDKPKIVDEVDGNDGEKTDFENKVYQLEKQIRLWHYCKRADKLAGIGKFGVLVLRFDDIEDPKQFGNKVDNPSELLGVRPFSRASIKDVKVGGPGSGRWGKPIQYQLDLHDENEAEGPLEQQGPKEMWVHHTRVIHIPSDELLDDEIRGIPRQKPVYNNLVDIEKTLGSAGELAYRATAWGLNVNISEDFNLEDGGEQMREHLNRWYYGLEPILRTQGADSVESLGGEDIDPGPVIDPNVEAISAQTGIPQSVLKGNETGERATTQDLKEWYGKIGERRNEFVTPLIIRELIDRLIEYEILPEPSANGSETVGNAYDVEWQPLMETSEEDQANIQNTRADTLETWPFGEEWLTPEQQKEFVETGSLPSELDTGELPALDESNEEVQAQFESLRADD